MDHSSVLQPQIAIRAWLVAAFAAFMIYLVLLKNGAILQSGAETLHELFHDGRHFLGVPCH